MARTLFRNCLLYRPTIDEEPLADAWLLVEDERIEKTGAGKPPASDKSVDLGGGLVLPGLINAHTHLYSALAPRMPWPERKSSDFVDILRSIWWRLDRALDERSLRVCARLGLHEAIKSGCTTIIDHHSSPGIPDGSLAIIAEEAERAGVKTILSCEVSERNGEDALEDCMDENLRAMRNYADHETVRGVYGLHASFTLSDESIDQILEILPFETPFHLHCAESEIDNEDAMESGFDGVVERLMSLGVLRPGSILAHGVHLQPVDLELIRDMGAFVVHCPQSNRYNCVGSADVGAMLAAGVRVGLGTDGFLSGLITEAGFARETGIERGTLKPKQLGELLYNGSAAIASSVFRRPVGWLADGEDADFIVFSDSRDPLAPEGKLERVVSRGRILFENDELLGTDEEALSAEADGEAERVWRRMADL